MQPIRLVFSLTALAAATCLMVSRTVAGHDDPPMRDTLYTDPDPSANGGLRGTVVYPLDRLVAVMAMPPHNPRSVYRGEITGGGNGFRFQGLPIAKYDLVLVFEKAFYEGLTLTYDEDTLTEEDRRAIAAHIHQSIPFFNVKRVHRIQGTTGREGTARSVLQELRTREIRRTPPGTRVRSLKLAFSEDVHIGWQMVHTRELLHQEARPGHYKELLTHHFHPDLGDIRVINSIRDLGELDLRDAVTSPDY